MLITRTPLFIGYSLTDPDFLSIRDVVRSRLGQFERMSYVIQIGATAEAVENALEDRIHIINVAPSGESIDRTLEELFLAAQRKLDARAGARLRRSRPDVFEEVAVREPPATADRQTTSALAESTSKLCFVMTPFAESFDRIYRELIVPAVEDAGLSAVRADEIPAAGFVMEQIRAAIQQARLCIADVTDRNPNVLYEVWFAQAMRKPVVLIANDVADLPFDIAAERVLRYGSHLIASRLALRRAIAHVLTENRFAEAEKLLATGSPRAAVAVAAVVLEHLLRELANKHKVSLRPRSGPAAVALALQQEGVIDINMRVAVEQANVVRNAAVHSSEREPTMDEAQLVLDTTKRVAALA